MMQHGTLTFKALCQEILLEQGEDISDFMMPDKPRYQVPYQTRRDASVDVWFQYQLSISLAVTNIAKVTYNNEKLQCLLKMRQYCCLNGQKCHDLS